MASTNTMPAITHVAVTVSDLAAACLVHQVLGVEPVLDEDTGRSGTSCTRSAARCSGCTASPTEHRGAVRRAPARPRPHRVRRRQPRRAGEWAARLDELGVAHGEIMDAHYGSGLSFRDPDNIALELFAPPA